jgi:hypothetical protein
VKVDEGQRRRGKRFRERLESLRKIQKRRGGAEWGRRRGEKETASLSSLASISA